MTATRTPRRRPPLLPAISVHLAFRPTAEIKDRSLWLFADALALCLPYVFESLHGCFFFL